MPQKPLTSKGKKAGPPKKQAANRHGKDLRVKKGRLSKPPKKGIAAKDFKESRELTKAINAENESKFAGVAASSGGHLAVIKAPPVLAPADQKNKTRPGK